MVEQRQLIPAGAGRWQTRRGRWLRLAVGLTGLLLLAGFFMSGYAPPGALGTVLRHNQVHEIDASPLFYSEVEHMAVLEAGARRWRAAGAQ